jgi:hypothetical protein
MNKRFAQENFSDNTKDRLLLPRGIHTKGIVSMYLFTTHKLSVTKITFIYF